MPLAWRRRDLDRAFAAPGLIEQTAAPLKEIVGRLKQTYCHSIGVEYMHLQDPEERAGCRSAWNRFATGPSLTAAERVELLEAHRGRPVRTGFSIKNTWG
jgi:2-oxoglutarate dehydrogenase complex dehydrogenase (E1) component-like enzyme